MSNLDKAKIEIVCKHPFWTIILSSLQMRVIPNITETPYDTAYTDGKQLVLSQRFLDTLSKPKTIGLIVHELHHVIFKHPCCYPPEVRTSQKHSQVWQQATDYAINLGMKDDGFKLPDNGLISEKFRGMDSYKIYQWLLDNPDSPEAKAGGFDEVQLSDLSPEDQESLKQTIVRAAEVARAEGKLSASMKKLVQGLTESYIPWQRVLREHFNSVCTDEYNWNRMNRRLIQSGLYLPSLHTKKLGKVCLCNDTSGSTQRMQKDFLSEMNCIFQDTKPEEVHVVYADSDVQEVKKYSRGEDLELEVIGGGGTRFSPTFKHIQESGEDYECIVYFTDLECSDFGEEPDCKVLWVTPKGYEREVPFGEVIVYESKA